LILLAALLCEARLCLAALPVAQLILTNANQRLSAGTSALFSGSLTGVSQNLSSVMGVACQTDKSASDGTNIFVRPALDFMQFVSSRGWTLPETGYHGALVELTSTRGLGTNDVVVGALEVTLGSAQYSETLTVNFSLNVPTLRITRSESGVELTWPTVPAGLELRAVDDPSHAYSWRPVTEPRLTNSGFQTVTEPPSARRRFYRLSVP
jgi:hypothetical protein